MGNSLLHRKEAIVLTSIEVINDYGIQGLSTREVARRQGISEGTIFKHFRTKNDLMLAILEHYSQYDFDIVETVRLKKLEPIEAITFIIISYAEYYHNYPQITAITQAYDMLSCDPGLTDKVKQVFTDRIDTIKALVYEAQKKGYIATGIDSEMLAHVICGSFRTICLKWRFSKYDFSLKEYVRNTLDMILNAFVIKSSTANIKEGDKNE